MRQSVIKVLKPKCVYIVDSNIKSPYDYLSKPKGITLLGQRRKFKAEQSSVFCLSTTVLRRTHCCVSMATVVMRMCHNVTWYIHCLSCCTSCWSINLLVVKGQASFWNCGRQEKSSSWIAMTVGTGRIMWHWQINTRN